MHPTSRRLVCTSASHYRGITFLSKRSSFVPSLVVDLKTLTIIVCFELQIDIVGGEADFRHYRPQGTDRLPGSAKGRRRGGKTLPS